MSSFSDLEEVSAFKRGRKHTQSESSLSSGSTLNWDRRHVNDNIRNLSNQTPGVLLSSINGDQSKPGADDQEMLNSILGKPQCQSRAVSQGFQGAWIFFILLILILLIFFVGPMFAFSKVFFAVIFIIFFFIFLFAIFYNGGDNNNCCSY
jgi:uncharacterized membrane protein